VSIEKQTAMSKVTMVAAVAGLFLMGCQKKEIQGTENKLTSGTWSVSKFLENNTDKTDLYDNSVYQFNKNGSIAITGTNVASGIWNVNGIRNSSNEHMEILLRMDGDYAALSGTWYIADETSDMIQLVEEIAKEEPASNEINYLTLTKN
jgi:hypothetical protein